MAGRSEELERQRLAKLEKIVSRGLDPYPAHYKTTHTAAEAQAQGAKLEGEAEAPSSISISVAGRITAFRSMGKATFLDLRDGSGQIQAYLKRDALGDERYDLLRELDLGDFLGVIGRLFRTRTGEITVEASECTILAKSLRPLPEKWHGLTDVETRYRQRYLDLIANEDARRTFILRSRVISAIRRFLDSRGFMEVETPILQSQAGGAAARPFRSHYNALDRDVYLRIATELHLKRLVVGGFDKVYEIGRVFRNEGVSTKHNPEYTLLESYEAYADYRDVMEMVEQMISCVAQDVLGKQTVTFGGTELELRPPWRRLTVRDAVREMAGVDINDYPTTESLRERMEDMSRSVDPTLGRGKLIDELISTYVEPRLIQPTFLYDYPVDLSPLAKQKHDDPLVVERFEPFIGGFEVGNAYSELNDPQEQRKRFQDQLRLRELGDEEAELLDEDFLTALEHGMPPTGGLGIGIDRLVMVLTDQQSIREVILFPQLRTKD